MGLGDLWGILLDWVARRGTAFRVQYQKAILYMHVYTLTRCIPAAMLFHPKYGNIPFSFVFVFFQFLSFLFLIMPSIGLSIKKLNILEIREMAQ